MDKPKRNWREYLKEYAIIVVGVLTALAAQQAAEWLHDRSRAAEARANIRAEMARNLGLMVRRQTTEACMAKRLDEVDGLIAASAAGKLPRDALWIGQPHNLGMDDNRYKAAVQSGAVSLFDDREQAAYSAFYGSLARYELANGEEMEDWASLRALEKHPSPSPALDVLLRNAIQMARIHRYQMYVTHQAALTNAAVYGVTPAQLRRPPPKMYPACVPLHTSREEALKLIGRNAP